MNFTEVISFWGGIASIIAIVIMLIEIIRKVLARIKANQSEQEKRYESMREGISYLTQNATTYQEKQEVFIYVSSMLDHGRHGEIRISMIAILMNILSGILLVILVISFFKSLPSDMEKYNLLIRSSILSAGIALTYYNFKIYIIIKKIRTINDSFASGFLNVIEEKMKKTLKDIVTESR
jgi:hypothetical protein